jgi:hypothetical protein
MKGSASMFKKIQTEKSPYQRYIMEADDREDQVSVTVAPRKNRGTDYDEDTAEPTNVRVAPHAGRGEDYSADTDEADPEVTDTEETEDTDIPAEPGTGDEGTDYSEEDSDESDGSTAGDSGAETSDESGEEDPDEEPVNGPDTGDEATDYSDDGDMGDEETEPAGDDTSTEETEESPTYSDEKTKKYSMYRRFLHLYNVIDSIIERIQSVVKNDPVQNTVIKTVTNNLVDLKDNTFDFMTVRYRKSSYVQILIFFETAISVVRLNFELLRNNKINLKQ